MKSPFTHSAIALLCAVFAALGIGLSQLAPFRAFETLILSSGILLLVLALEMRLKDAENRAEELVTYGVIKRLDAVLAPERERLAGITRSYGSQREAFADFLSSLRSSSHRADILQLSIYDIVTGPTRTELEAAMRRGVRVRLLMLDPDSPFVEMLTSDSSAGRLRDEIRASLDWCRAFALRDLSFEIRLYREPQAFNLFFVEEFAVLLPRLPLQIHRGLALRVERGRTFADLEDFFEGIWQTASPVQLPKRAIV